MMKWKWIHHLPLSVFTLLMPGIVMVYLLSYHAHHHMNIAWAFAAIIGLSYASMHLGQPRNAMSALRHLYRSWLSREMIFFTLFLFGLICQLVFPVLATQWYWYAVVSFAGLCGVISTMMVYRKTPRIGKWPVELDFLLEMLFCGSAFLPTWFYFIIVLKVVKDLYLSSVLWSEKDSISLLTAALAIFTVGISPADPMTAIFVGLVNALFIRMAFFHRLDRSYLAQSADRQRDAYLPQKYRKYFQPKKSGQGKF
jgi:DMSO reductase anchor subunit